MLLWLFLTLIASVLSTNKVCPDGSYKCPDTATCCELADKSYGCCPLKNAVCCDDHIHCCPQNTKCETGICIELDEINVSKKISAKNEIFQKNGSQSHSYAIFSSLTKSNNNIASVVCPGSSFQCPNGYTCCQLPSGDWGCCPFVNATCCSDHLHCCPQNMQCDSTSQACSQGLVSVLSLPKELSKPVTVSITCPDNSTCAESMTCCELKNRHFGCCPYKDAVCCEDYSHCCPDGFICDVVEKACMPKQKWLSNVVSKYYRKLG